MEKPWGSQMSEDHQFGGDLWSTCCLRNISEDAEVAIFPLRAKDFHLSHEATDTNIWHEDLGVVACFSFTFPSKIQQSSNRSLLNLLFVLWNITMFQGKKRYPKSKTITTTRNLKKPFLIVSLGFVTGSCILGASAAHCYIPDWSVRGSAEWFVEELMTAEEDNKNQHLSLSSVVIHLK